MEVKANFLKGTQFTVIARGHQIICDQPIDNNGADTGMTPPEFLLASLATCAGYYAAQYLKTRGLSAEGLEVSVTAEKAKQPARLGLFQIDLQMPELEERHREGVLRAAKACLIHNTLLHAPEINIAVHAHEPALAAV